MMCFPPGGRAATPGAATLHLRVRCQRQERKRVSNRHLPVGASQTGVLSPCRDTSMNRVKRYGLLVSFSFYCSFIMQQVV